MKIFFANQRRTYEAEKKNSCLWSPKLDKSGRKNPGYELMREVCKGDFILNNAGGEIAAISIAKQGCQPGRRPWGVEDKRGGYDWESDGWLIPAAYYELLHPLRISDLTEAWLGGSSAKDSAFIVEPRTQYLCNLAPHHARYILTEILRHGESERVKDIANCALVECD